jgi:hypothetical protein
LQKKQKKDFWIIEKRTTDLAGRKKEGEKRFLSKLGNFAARGQRCDQNFRRFPTIFGEKISVFLKNRCYTAIFAKKTSKSLCKKLQFFGESIQKIHNIGPGLLNIWPTVTQYLLQCKLFFITTKTH